jgi:hypothetical protein
MISFSRMNNFCRLGWKNTVRGAVVARVEIDRGGLVRGSFETH